MIVRVKPKARGEGTSNRVSFECPDGSGEGLWHGREAPTAIALDVELAFGEPLFWGDAIRGVLDGPDAIYQQNDLVCLRGRLEALDDDCVAWIRIGASVILAETRGAPGIASGPVLITVPAGHLHLYPTGA